MKKIWFLILFSLLLETARSENYHGRVVSVDGNKGIVGATIQFFSQDIFVGGGKSGDGGSFHVTTSQKATRMTVSYIGNDTYVRRDSLGLPEDLETVSMQSSGVRLGEVTVKASLRRERYDKDIYLITDSMRKGTASSAQLLEKVPGVLRDWENDNLRIDGENDIVLLVNDVEKSAGYAMRINPKRIKQVEIIRNPVGKYDGRRMLVNISLYDDYIGWDFVPNATGKYGRNSMHQETVGGTYTYSIDKLSVNFTTSLDNHTRKESDDFVRAYGADFEKKSSSMDLDIPNRHRNNLTYNLSLGAEYQIKKGHSLSIQGNGAFAQALDSTRYFIMERNEGVTSQYEQGNKDRYYSDDLSVGAFYRGTFGHGTYVSSDLTYNFYDVKERRSFFEQDNSSVHSTLGKKNHVFYDLSISRPLSSKFDAYVDYNIAWRKYDDEDRASNASNYWSKNVRHFLLAMLTWHPTGNFSIGGGALWLGNSDDNSNGHTADYSWTPMARLFFKPWKNVSLRSNFHISATYPNLDQLSATEYQVDSWMVHGGNPLLKASSMKYWDSYLTIDGLFTISFVNFYNKNMNDMLFYSQLPDGMVKESYANVDWHRTLVGVSGDYKLFSNCYGGINLSYFHDALTDMDGMRKKGDAFKLYLQGRYMISPLSLNVQAAYELDYSSTPTPQGRFRDHEDGAKVTLYRTFAKGRLEMSLTAKAPVNLVSRKYGMDIRLPYFTNVTNSSTNNYYGPYLSLSTKLYLHGGKQVRMSHNSFKTDVEK